MRPKVLEKLKKINDLIAEEMEVFDQYRLTGSLSVQLYIKEGMINVVDISPKNTMKI